MNEQQQQQPNPYGHYQAVTTNQPYIEPNVLQLRLETAELLQDIQEYLTGERVMYINTGDTVKTQKIRMGESVANSSGAGSLISWIKTQTNPSVVQGYIKEDGQYFYYLERTRKAFAKMLLVNSPRWGIRRENRLLLITSIMNMIEMFISRALDNTERESYRNTNLAAISPIPQHKKKGIGM